MKILAITAIVASLVVGAQSLQPARVTIQGSSTTLQPAYGDLQSTYNPQK